MATPAPAPSNVRVAQAATSVTGAPSILPPQGGSALSSDPKPVPQLSHDARAKRKDELRKRRNRMSAAESRKRKAEIVQQLEGAKKDLGDVNACLQSTSTLLKFSNEHLMARIKAARAAVAAKYGNAVAARLCAGATAKACAATAASRPARELAAGVGVPVAPEEDESAAEHATGVDAARAAVAKAGADAVVSSRRLLDFVSAPLDIDVARDTRSRRDSGAGSSAGDSFNTDDLAVVDDLAGVGDDLLDAISLGDIPADTTDLSVPELMAEAVPVPPAAAPAPPPKASGGAGDAAAPWHSLLATPVEMVAVAPSPAPACIVSTTRGRGVPAIVTASASKKARVGSLGGSPTWPSFA